VTDLDGMLAQLGGPGAFGVQHSALEHQDLLRAFEALPEEQRAVLLLVGVEDVSYQEAARVLGVPIGRMLLALGLL
jgi:DNA-directed RNA polymerase specialized sigma24 family protein